MLDCLVIALSCFTGFYLRFREFGLYEDDFSIIAPALNFDFSAVLRTAFEGFLDWPEGRPLGCALMRFFTFAGHAIFGSLGGVYIIAFLVYAACAILVYRFCLVTWGMRRLALLTALLFTLWPSDKARALLSHVFHPILGILFFLCFLIFYQRSKKALAFFSLALSLLTYEFALTCAWWVPLCFFWQGPRSRDRLKTLAKDTVALFAIGFVYFILRASQHEYRMLLTVHALASVGVVATLGRVFWSMIIGPWTALSAPFRLAAIEWSWSAAVLASALAFAIGLALVRSRKSRERQDGSGSRLAAAILGTGLFILPYSICAFVPARYPPIILAGRMSGTHVTGLFGMALCLGAGIDSALSWIEVSRRQFVLAWACGALALLFAVFVRYGMDVQADQARAWVLEKELWQNILAKVHAVEEGGVVFLERRPLLQTRHIQVRALSHLFNRLFLMPVNWRHAPLLVDLSEDWIVDFRFERFPDGSVHWNPPAFELGEANPTLPSEKVILLKVNGTDVQREGNVAPATASALVLSSAPRKPLYRLIWPESPALFR